MHKFIKWIVLVIALMVLIGLIKNHYFIKEPVIIDTFPEDMNQEIYVNNYYQDKYPIFDNNYNNKIENYSFVV